MNLSVLACIYIFFIYAFFGWIIEVVGKLLEKKVFINRGFLVGPICPIYGYGCLIITLLLSRFLNEPAVLFCTTIIIISILEYFTSYFMEKLFNARWWDYSKNKYNINGRICLETMIPFGIGAMIVMYLMNPLIFKLMDLVSVDTLWIIAYLFTFLYIVDNIISFSVILNIKNTFKKVVADSTEDITKRVKEVLLSKSLLYRRIIMSFPDLKIAIEKIKNNLQKLRKINKKKS